MQMVVTGCHWQSSAECIVLYAICGGVDDDLHDIALRTLPSNLQHRSEDLPGRLFILESRSLHLLCTT